MKKSLCALMILTLTLCTFAQKRNEICISNINYVRTNTINGGNYLLLRYGYHLTPHFTLKADLATDVVPEHLDDLLTTAHLRYNSNTKKSGPALSASLFYMANFGDGIKPDHYAGSRFVILGFTTDDNDVKIELLPFSIMYDITSEMIFASYELIDLTFLF
ncbi:MAG: hypothetical protein ACLFVE_01375 [Chitinispirillaceae bacterium]